VLITVSDTKRHTTLSQNTEGTEGDARGGRRKNRKGCQRKKEKMSKEEEIS
jgi:hypothetical protein